VAGGELGDVVGLQVRGDTAESATHNLLDLSRVEVNARSEFGHFRCNWKTLNRMNCAVSRGLSYLIARDLELGPKKSSLEEHYAVDNSNSTFWSRQMAPIMTGKRNRDTSVVSRSNNSDDASPSPPLTADNAQDVFRKYFEAQFAPLDLPATRPTGGSNSEEEEEEDDDSEGSEMDEQWDGVSDDESDEDVVEVVEHTDTRATDDRVDKKAYKAFMVSIYYTF
jgi:hypothetical protein